MKRLFGMLAAVSLAFAVLVPGVWAQDEPKEPAAEEDSFGNIMHTSFPAIGAVKFAKPAAGSPCKISAEVSMIGDEDPIGKLTSVKLIYYVNIFRGHNIVYWSLLLDWYSGDTISFIWACCLTQRRWPCRMCAGFAYGNDRGGKTK